MHRCLRLIYLCLKYVIRQSNPTYECIDSKDDYLPVHKMCSHLRYQLTCTLNRRVTPGEYTTVKDLTNPAVMPGTIGSGELNDIWLVKEFGLI